MSAEALAWVKSLQLGEGYTTTDKLILMMLADRADEHGFLWVSGSRLCQQIGINRSTLTRRLKHLESVYVFRMRRHRPNGSQTSNLWLLDMGRSSEQMSALVLAVADCEGDPVQQLEAVVQRAQESCAGVHTPDTPGEVSSRSSNGKRARDPLWDQLVEIFGEPETDSAKALRGKTLSSLKRAGATPDEVVARAKRWPLHYTDATFTETALEKHWHTLARKPLRRTT